MRWLLLAALAAGLTAAPSAGAWTWPTDGPVLRAFSFGGNPYAAGLHRGIDIGGPPGGTVVAAAGGTVSFTGTVPSGGNTVTVQTADGYAVTLVHLGSITATRGAEVAEGAPVGTIGPTGEPELGEPYVHLGVRVSSEPEGYVDPLRFLPGRGAPVATASTAAPPAASPAPAPETVPSTATPPAAARPTAATPPAGATSTDSPGADAPNPVGSSAEEASPTPTPSTGASASVPASAAPPTVSDAATSPTSSPSAETGAAAPVTVGAAAAGEPGPAPGTAAEPAPATATVSDGSGTAPSGRGDASPAPEAAKSATATVAGASADVADDAVQPTAATEPAIAAAAPASSDPGASPAEPVAAVPADGAASAGPPPAPQADASVAPVAGIAPAAAPTLAVSRPAADVQQAGEATVDVPADAASTPTPATVVTPPELHPVATPPTAGSGTVTTRGGIIAAAAAGPSEGPHSAASRAAEAGVLVHAVHRSVTARGASAVSAQESLVTTSGSGAKLPVRGDTGAEPAARATHVRPTVHDGSRADVGTSATPAAGLRPAPVRQGPGRAAGVTQTTNASHGPSAVVPRRVPLILFGVLAALTGGAAALAVILRRRLRSGATRIAGSDGDGWGSSPDEESTVLPDVDALLRDIARVEGRRARMRAAGDVGGGPLDDRVAEPSSHADAYRERVLV